MAENNITDFIQERFKRGLHRPVIDNDIERTTSGGGDDDGGGSNMSGIDNRLSKLEGSYDSLKVVRPMTLATVSLVLAVMVFGFAFLGTQMVSLSNQISHVNDKIDANAARVNEKLDAVPQRLAEEFRAMRAEMSAQTAAIASAVTAAKQVPPQVLLFPAPAVEAPTPKP